MEAEFYAAVTDPAAYHPWPIASGVEAEAFNAFRNVKVDLDKSENEEVTAWAGTGSWADYPVAADSAGTYVLKIRCRSDSAAQFGISDRGAGAVVPVDIPAGAAWTDLEVPLRVESGVRSIRVESLKGAFLINRIRPR
jgi:hypothetical protein